ncbi:unnamed protein product [Phytophthora lilii]|uniref:Unnamed protein product n=1 Tax=Phytophthora lilii TaxID=2077276 RepID=A0A9W6X8R0_9STRA|nr:unnamed protein product [Phytophthora lilii]
MLSVIGIAGNEPSLIYDAKLDQWGISAKTPRESVPEYFRHVFDSSIFIGDSMDISAWSLSSKGAAEENAWVSTLPNIYYYSYANVDSYSTRDWLLRVISLPNILTMMPPLDATSIFLGSRYGPNHGFSTKWQPNDGM